ncbi:MAG TPA: hypothetical protein VJM34_07685 [Novosphingobium sp.]|nr:hypothetical protein [Novosphingobium sp.]
MENQNGELHIDRDEARAGSTPHIVRYVLLISLTLAIVALSAIWIIGALNSAKDTGGVADTRRAVAETQ